MLDKMKEFASGFFTKFSDHVNPKSLYEDLEKLRKSLATTENKIFEVQYSLTKLYDENVGDYPVPVNSDDGDLFFAQSFRQNLSGISIHKQIEEISGLVNHMKLTLRHWEKRNQYNESMLSQAYAKIAAVENQLQGSNARSAQLEAIIKKNNEVVMKAKDEWQAQYAAVLAQVETAEDKMKSDIVKWLRTKPKASVYGYENLYEKEMNLEDAAISLERNKWKR
jgi:hypothetical protein